MKRAQNFFALSVAWNRVLVVTLIAVLTVVFVVSVWYLLAVVLPARERAEALIHIKQLELRIYGKTPPRIR